MQRREKLTKIFTVVAVLGAVLIATVSLLVSKEYFFVTYKNTAVGFTIKYPPKWTFEGNQNGAAVIFFSPLDNPLDYFKDNVTVVVQDNPKALSLIEYSELAVEQMKAVFTDNFEILDSGPVTLSGFPAYKLVFVGKGPDTEVKYKIVWAVAGSKVYQISYLAFPSSYDRFLPKVDKMIGSFKIK